MTAPYCADCGDHVAPDGDHVVVNAEHKLINDRNQTDDYYFHRRCWLKLTEGWVMPA